MHKFVFAAKLFQLRQFLSLRLLISDLSRQHFVVCEKDLKSNKYAIKHQRRFALNHFRSQNLSLFFVFVATVYFLHLWKIGESQAVGWINTCVYDISEILTEMLSSTNSLTNLKSFVTKLSPDIIFPSLQC